MNPRRTLISLLALAVSATVSLAGAAGARSAGPSLKKPIVIKKLHIKEVGTPEYEVKASGTTSSNSGDEREWLQIIVEFDNYKDWINEIDFVYYVTTKAKSAADVKDLGGKQYNTFTGRCTHVHVKKGRSRLVSMYLHPVVLERFGDWEVAAVWAEIGGQTVAAEYDSQGKSGKVHKQAKTVPKWWEGGIYESKPQEGWLLNRNQTPFKFMRYDDFATIKPVLR